MRFLVKMRFNRALATESVDEWHNRHRKGLLHSDTLFGGIANQWIKVPTPYSIDELIARLSSSSPPFRISSAFPFAGDEYYLPTPIGVSASYMDTLKNVPYLELADFLRLAQGEAGHLQRLRDRDPVSGIIYGSTAPRLTIDRMTFATSVYDTRGWSFAANSGLYFILEVCDPEMRGPLELCIRLLGESGIGSDRSVGFGSFKANLDPIDDHVEWAELFSERTGPDVTHCALSLIYPRDHAEARASVSYDIIPRRGWILSTSSTVQAKRIGCRMFTEGSLFKIPVRGHLADVRPSIFADQHEVWRYGIALTVSGAW